jgi:hypothetical protein
MGLTLSTVCGQAMDHLVINCVSIRPEEFEFSSDPGFFFQIANGFRVGGYDPGSGAGFDRHVADHQAARGRHLLDGRAMELDDLEIGALGRQLADQVQNQVLGRDMALELALTNHLDGAGNFDVQHPPQSPDSRHFRGADAEGESAEGAVAGGVAVRADHDVSRPDITEFRQDLVADAAAVAADVMKSRDPLLGHEIPDLLLVAGCF